MKAPGTILLLSCYELGHQPLALASLQARLREAGYQPRVIDSAVEPLSEEEIRAARLVAISVPMHTALRLGEALARRIRASNPRAYLCFYGLYALLNADYLLREVADAVLGGEYEEPLLALVRALERGEEQPGVPGVRTREQVAGAWLQRPAFVVPQRHGLPELQRYARLEWNGQYRLAGYTETTRGCKHTCLHCPITPVYRGRFFAVPQEVVLADIRAQVEQGAEHITFGDPDFFNGPTHALRIARALHREFPTVTFDATIKIEHLLKHRHLLPELRELGCLFVVSAVESLNDEVLRHLHKGHSAADAVAAFGLMEEVGLTLRPSLLPFSPWETLESYLALLDFFEERHLIEQVDPVHFSIRLLIPPGSALLESEGRPAWLGELDEAAYSYRWQHPDPRMDRLQERVAALAEEAAQQGEHPVETFFRIKEEALAVCGRSFDREAALRSYGEPRRPPRLTESWFCCAEPTRGQFGSCSGPAGQQQRAATASSSCCGVGG
ncbi:MAG: B12-binding domain-containing radical SAM protein [Thermogemmatispora sp.]|uniref:CUAEP/CCAEP-tail radical SAM (seleno)protein n=1 Tax=Thermogemmatispora sp. TaxID=1968838 RepID=UPI00262AA863|nr:CUAEP/CCAEP-tail radical SAM protein [Thermogemmatispora sp.]MBX5457490.1 B12-binding domain-containing radical SAM protein [Thermogemmatispora sp.]